MRGQSFPVAAALDGLWGGLDRVDSRFREVESLGLVRWNHAAQDPLPRPDPWWKSGPRRRKPHPGPPFGTCVGGQDRWAWGKLEAP